jgi:hypothetical protein
VTVWVTFYEFIKFVHGTNLCRGAYQNCPDVSRRYPGEVHDEKTRFPEIHFSKASGSGRNNKKAAAGEDFPAAARLESKRVSDNF